MALLAPHQSLAPITIPQKKVDEAAYTAYCDTYRDSTFKKLWQSTYIMVSLSFSDTSYKQTPKVTIDHTTGTDTTGTDMTRYDTRILKVCRRYILARNNRKFCMAQIQTQSQPPIQTQSQPPFTPIYDMATFNMTHIQVKANDALASINTIINNYNSSKHPDQHIIVLTIDVNDIGYIEDTRDIGDRNNTVVYERLVKLQANKKIVKDWYTNKNNKDKIPTESLPQFEMHINYLYLYFAILYVKLCIIYQNLTLEEKTIYYKVLLPILNKYNREIYHYKLYRAGLKSPDTNTTAIKPTEETPDMQNIKWDVSTPYMFLYIFQVCGIIATVFTDINYITKTIEAPSKDLISYVHDTFIDGPANSNLKTVIGFNYNVSTGTIPVSKVELNMHPFSMDDLFVSNSALSIDDGNKLWKEYAERLKDQHHFKKIWRYFFELYKNWTKSYNKFSEETTLCKYYTELVVNNDLIARISGVNGDKTLSYKKVHTDNIVDMDDSCLDDNHISISNYNTTTYSILTRITMFLQFLNGTDTDANTIPPAHINFTELCKTNDTAQKLKTNIQRNIKLIVPLHTAISIICTTFNSESRKAPTDVSVITNIIENLHTLLKSELRWIFDDIMDNVYELKLYLKLMYVVWYIKQMNMNTPDTRTISSGPRTGEPPHINVTTKKQYYMKIIQPMLTEMHTFVTEYNKQLLQKPDKTRYMSFKISPSNAFAYNRIMSNLKEKQMWYIHTKNIDPPPGLINFIREISKIKASPVVE